MNSINKIVIKIYFSEVIKYFISRIFQIYLIRNIKFVRPKPTLIISRQTDEIINKMFTHCYTFFFDNNSSGFKCFEKDFYTYNLMELKYTKLCSMKTINIYIDSIHIGT